MKIYQKLIPKSVKNSIKRYLCIVLSVFACLIVNAQNNTNSKKILLLGNSLTYYNNMSKMLSKMFYKSNINTDIYEIAKPGVWLQYHYKNISGNGDYAICKNYLEVSQNKGILVKLDKQEHWDWVILQDAPVRMLIPEIRKAFFERYTKRLDSLVKRVNGHSILFLPYTVHQRFPVRHCHPENYQENVECPNDICCSDTLYSSDDELKVYLETVTKLQNENGFTVAPIGIAFDKIIKYSKNIRLFADDEGHPSELGSFLMACVYFQTITGFAPNKIEPKENVNYQLMNQLIEISKSCF
jgi:hypothetical protein